MCFWAKGPGGGFRKILSSHTIRHSGVPYAGTLGEPGLGTKKKNNNTPGGMEIFRQAFKKELGNWMSKDIESLVK